MGNKVILSFFICASLLLSGCKNPFEAKDKGFEQLNNIENRWVDTHTLASSTSRISLVTPVSQLQEIKRDLLSIELSECLNPAREALNSYMDMHINNFLKFMANENIGELKSNTKLVEYLAIKTKCVGDKTNSNPNLVAEAQAIEALAKAEAESLAKFDAEIAKIAKEQGISLEAATAVVASEALAEAEAAAALAEAALAEPILPPNS